MKLTNNFELKEFLNSRFFGVYQDKVIESFESNQDLLLPDLQKLANNLQVLRNHINKPISINIAYRPMWWEAMKGRSGMSKHTQCKAADIVVKGMKPKQVKDAIEQLIKDGKMQQGGLSSYPKFTHYDIRGTKSRW